MRERLAAARRLPVARGAQPQTLRSRDRYAGHLCPLPVPGLQHAMADGSAAGYPRPEAVA